MHNLPKNNRFFFNKESIYYKLFNYILYQENENRKNNIDVKNNEKRNSFIYNNKPITVEHFIKEDIHTNNYINETNSKRKKEFDINEYYNIELTGSKSNEGKSNYNNELNGLDNYINNKNNISRNGSISSSKNSIKKDLTFHNNNIEYFKKKINNKEILNILLKEKNKNYSLNNGDNNKFFFSYNKNNNNTISETKYNFSKKKISKRNCIGFVLAPKRIKNKLNRNKSLIIKNNKNKIKSNISIDNIPEKKYFLSNFSKKRTIDYSPKKLNFSNDNKFIKNNIFKINKGINDMNLKNKFRLLKKELSDEKIKIKNMMSEFFKNSLYKKYNNKDVLIALIKQKNMLNRPKSAIS